LFFIKNLIVITSKCDNTQSGQCFSYPSYKCCQGCNVIEEDASGKWGIENNEWCGIKDSCFDSNTQIDNPSNGNCLI